MNQICNTTQDWGLFKSGKNVFAIDIVRVIFVNIYFILFVLICFKKLQI